MLGITRCRIFFDALWGQRPKPNLTRIFLGLQTSFQGLSYQQALCSVPSSSNALCILGGVGC